MMWWVVVAALAAVVGEPEKEPGALDPWQSSDIMPGDQWAVVYIDVDEKGRPTDCKLGKNKLKREMGFFVCRAFLGGWEGKPKIENGAAVKHRVQRFMIIPGRAHREKDERERKRQGAPPEKYPG